MFTNKKREVVMTDIFCKNLNNLTLAMEVLLGQRVHIKRLDFNSWKGQIYVGNCAEGIVKDIEVTRLGDSIGFWFVGEYIDGFLYKNAQRKTYIARFKEELGEVRVICKCTEISAFMWQVGRAYDDRWEESLFGKKG